MILKDMFAKPIDRDIKGVIKVGQDDNSNIKQELEEYVVTRELQKHFAEFFASYKRGINGNTDKMGVWISGFFGSGKSHFLKILSYLLANKTVDGKSAIDYFAEDNKIADPMVMADIIGAKLNGKSIPQICADRRKRHFGNKFKCEYFVLENAYYIISDCKYKFVNGIGNILKKYTEETFAIDRRYRYFYFYFDKLLNTVDFENLRDLVENIYTNEYLNKITANWSKELASADFETGISKQHSFYSKYIKTSADRVVVIVSDALRYEVAHTLFEKMKADEKCKVSIEAMQGVLPSYTPLGMASLLPHEQIEYNDKFEILVDKNLCASTEQREAILKKYNQNSCCVRFDELKTMKQAELRAVFTGKQVIYVYHNQVDARGDDAKTENEVFTACEEAINEIYDFIKRVASQANTYHFMVTSDHGFIYKRDKIEASDKISSIKANGTSIGQRYLLAEEAIDQVGTEKVSIGKILNNNDQRFISFPIASDIFKVAGSGQNYVHGGCSPQEMIVPVIDVKVDKNRVETTTAKISLVSLSNKITNLITSFDFVQTEPVSSMVKETVYRIYFVSE